MFKRVLLQASRIASVVLAAMLLYGGAASRAEPPTDRHDGIEVMASLSTTSHLAIVPKSMAVPRQVTILLAGDFGLSPHQEPVNPQTAAKHGQRLTWAQMLERIAPHTEANLKFANVETVVSDRNDLRPEPKAFNFKSHPEGVRHLVRNGFNVLGLANNHAMDYGTAGLAETLRHLEAMRTDGLLAFAGLGDNRQAAGRAHLFHVNDKAIAFAAIGIVSEGHGHHRASATRPGQLSYRAAEDFGVITQELAAAPAAYKMLSIHFGSELSVEPGADQIRNAREIAVGDRGIDLIAGHHAHVVQGIELVDGRLIFYGLGNFLHLGTQDMSRFGLCRDYSILARIHLVETASGQLAARAVEVIPITRTHVRPEPLAPAAARERIEVVNFLSRRLTTRTSRARAFELFPRTDGSGLFCTPEASVENGRIGELCRQWRAPAPPDVALTQRIAQSCRPSALSRNTRPPAETAHKREHARPRSLFTSLFRGQ